MANLLGWLRKRPNAPGDTVPLADFQALTARVQALETAVAALDADELLRHEVVWGEIRDQIKKHLQRSATYETRLRERQEREQGGGDDKGNLRALLALKYPKLAGGE